MTTKKDFQRITKKLQCYTGSIHQQFNIHYEILWNIKNTINTQMLAILDTSTTYWMLLRPSIWADKIGLVFGRLAVHQVNQNLPKMWLAFWEIWRYIPKFHSEMNWTLEQQPIIKNNPVSNKVQILKLKSTQFGAVVRTITIDLIHRGLKLDC